MEEIQVRKIISLSILAALGASALAVSDLELKSANHIYREFYPTLNYPGSTTSRPTGFFNPGNASSVTKDTLNEHGFWMRLSNYKSSGINPVTVSDGREYQMFNEYESSANGAEGAKGFIVPGINGAVNEALRFNLRYKLNEVDANSAYVKIDWFIENKMNNDVEIDLYSLNDLDGPQTAMSDTGAYANGIMSFLGDMGGAFAYAPGATSWEMNTFGAGDAIDKSLTDNAITGALSNSIKDNKGDIVGAFHWKIKLGAGQGMNGSVYRGYGAVPEPATMIALGGGLLALARRRNKK